MGTLPSISITMERADVNKSLMSLIFFQQVSVEWSTSAFSRGIEYKPLYKRICQSIFSPPEPHSGEHK